MTVRKPQLFHSADVKDIQQFIDDPEWALEQKVDGMRCLTVIRPGGVEFLTREGRPLKSAAAKLHFHSIAVALEPFVALLKHGEEEIVLDGELLTDTGVLVLLDLPYAEVGQLIIRPSDPLVERRATLRDLWVSLGFKRTNIALVAHADTMDYKMSLFKDVDDANLEGVIAKRLDSPYDEGERVRHSLKLKRTSTADVVVLAKNEGESKHSIRGGDKINYEFGVYAWVDSDATTNLADYKVQERKLVHVGNCSGIGKGNAEVGDVIEVEYLYRGAGGKLVQPRMVGLREDKAPADCLMNQFRVYSKELL